MDGDELSALELAKITGTIPYEIITVMGELNKRVYVKKCLGTKHLKNL